MGGEGWNGGEYYEIVPYEEDRPHPLYFPIRRETRLSLSSMGVELEAIDDAHNVVFSRIL